MVEEQVPAVLGRLDDPGVDVGADGQTVGTPDAGLRSTSTAWATAMGYCSMSSPKSSGAWELDSVMPRIPAAA